MFAALLLHKDVLPQQSFSLSPLKPLLSPVPVSGQPVSVGDSSERFSLPRKIARVPPVPLGVPEGDKAKQNKLSRLAPGKNPCCSENKAARGSRRVQAAQAPRASPEAERTQDARSSPKARQGGTRRWAEGVLLHQNRSRAVVRGGGWPPVGPRPGVPPFLPPFHPYRNGDE